MKSPPTGERARDFRRRASAARKDGGSAPSPDAWSALLETARSLIARRWNRLSFTLGVAPAAVMNEPHDFVLLGPGEVAVPATTVLGLEIELNQARADRESAEEHRLHLLALIAKATTAPLDGDLVGLDQDIRRCLTLTPEAKERLLAVIRELESWRDNARLGAGIR